MKRIIFSILFFGIIGQNGHSQLVNSGKLDSLFNTLEVNNKFMGSVAVSQNGEIIYTRTMGFADLENNIKANENSKYRIGSISKTFTAVLTLKAVEKNKLDLNQTIENYFPTIKNADKITVNHLLRHRSGIPDFTNNVYFLIWNTIPKTESEMIEIIATAGSDFEPDSKSAYSNSNFVLLTFILEKSFHKSYAELVKKYIATPLELENTYFGGEINPVDKECKSYYFNTTWQLGAETNTSVALGAGGIVSTPSDLVKFSDALFGGKLLKAKSLEQMKTMKENYGLGLVQIPFYNKQGYGHSGAIDGFNSVFSYFSDGNTSYALTSNGTTISNNVISIAVLSAVYNKPFDIPEFSTYKVATEDLDPYLGIYSSPQFPLKITISKSNTTLIAQATGQANFQLEATSKDKFKFDQAGIVLEFNATANSMLLKQGGGQFLFTKE